MRLIGFILLAGCEIAQSRAAVQPSTSAVVIDGELSDSFWNRLAPGQLSRVGSGVDSGAGGEIRTALAGGYLYIAARLPERTGRFTARSIGRNPEWEEEDSLALFIRAANENDWMLKVGPLGAYSVKWRWSGESDWYTSRPEKCSGFLVAAARGAREWRVEAAIPLRALGSPEAGTVHISAERIRASRPGVPQERWQWPRQEPLAEVPGSRASHLSAPVFRTAALGNDSAPIEVGHRGSLPAPDSKWIDDTWRQVPVWILYRNQPGSRLPQFQTEVKMIQDGHTLAVMARCAEPYGTVGSVREQDGPVDQDDSFQVYLATTDSSYVKYAINVLGYIQDASGFSGGPRISRPHVDWNSPVRGSASRSRGEWFARLDLPLDFIADTLGEVGTPRNWRILFMRYRPSRDGEPQETSVLPVTQSVTPYCSARYRNLTLVESDPAALRGMQAAVPSGNLEFAPTRVLSDEQRKEMTLSGMLDRNIHDRTLKFLEEERRDWDRVQALQDWEKFRQQRKNALSASIGEFPQRRPLATHVMKVFRGDGYRREDLVFQSQPGVWVTANLYLPAESKGRMPGIVIAHSLHAAKTQFELQDMGMLWAREGCAVLVMDLAGFGERIEGYPWSRDGYHSRYITGMQLYLVGESLIKWMVWDLIRGIDLLAGREDIDNQQIILLGSVAGGGDPAAITAALDSRVAAVVPFNFGESTPEIPRFIPEKNQWPLELADPGLGDWDTTRCLRRAVVDQFLQWTICAMAAPRRFVYSYELGWNVKDLPAWSRYTKVYDLYHATDHLADAHGFGPFPGPGECWNIGPAQRRSLYPTLERWFGIPLPLNDMRSSIRANLSIEPSDRRPEAELQVLTPATASELHMRTIHEIAREMARHKIESARATMAGLTVEKKREWLESQLASRLGNIEPIPHPQAEVHWSKKLPDATVEGITVKVEPNITVPLLVFRPGITSGSRPRVVVGVAEAGKAGFLEQRPNEISALLRKGIAVCLPDVRGTGEATPDGRRDPENDENMQAVNEEMLGETLVGRRLKDLRSVLAYLRGREDLDAKRLGLWGESLTPVNPARLVEDELPLWTVGPQIQQQGEPLGGMLALLTALYEPTVRAVAVRGGLISFTSILEDAFAYIPADITVPGFLEAGDLADVEVAIAPRPLLLENLIDGKNRMVAETQARDELRPVSEAYRSAQGNFELRADQQASSIAGWLAGHL
jgi:dienelactone hydrolase